MYFFCCSIFKIKNNLIKCSVLLRHGCLIYRYTYFFFPQNISFIFYWFSFLTEIIIKLIIPSLLLFTGVFNIKAIFCGGIQIKTRTQFIRIILYSSVIPKRTKRLLINLKNRVFLFQNNLMLCAKVVVELCSFLENKLNYKSFDENR